MSRKVVAGEEIMLIPTNSIIKKKLNISIRKAINYLQSQRMNNGGWQCFKTLAGISDEWVTAYVGCCLASWQDEQARHLAEKAYRFLSRRRWLTSGWGYNKFVPCDADSTAWALRLGELLQIPSNWKRNRAYNMLQKHINVSGGVSTYSNDRQIRFFTGLQKNISFRGWCSPHTCVTAAVANLEKKRYAIAHAYLKQTQKQDGSWGSYWWTDIEYSTALAASALYRISHYDSSFQKGLKWGYSRIGKNHCIETKFFPHGSAFASAWLLYLLNLSRKIKPAIQIAEWEIENQLPDGSWAESAMLRIPPPNCIDPDSYLSWSTTSKGGGSIIVDKNRVFTTATVLFALQNFYKNCL